MENIKIVNVAIYRDGGTAELHLEDGRKFYIDYRIGTKTPGEVYDAYPDKGTFIENKELSDALKTAFNNR